MWIALIAAAISACADILTKLYIAQNYTLYQYTELIPGILNITNVSNDGIAFGMLDNARWLFMLATGLLVVGLLAFVIFVKGYHKLLYTCAGLVLGGGIGNFIDRIVSFGRYDEPKCVVDFIDFCAFPELWMWTFNIADVAVCVGAGLFVLYLIAFDKKAFESGKKAVLYEEKKNGGKADE